MESNINYIKKEVQAMEKMYDFIREVAQTSDVILLEIYGTRFFEDIIMQNSAYELYDKWYAYRKKKLESDGWFLD